ncbi:myotubularin-related protein 8-like isoform X1 [Ctenocephalides felis]|uniref:myotubularin-related protein 8-like isoform X1 n=1 Tax=Ctenocephalides felis TaxID=7515 RepID=UPI000E6E1FBE|nr:myotubularin-related protein 8-like isoform X1 [Ctenocephalides felis]
MEIIRTPKVENVRMLDRYNSRKPSKGTLYITATHLIFVDPDAKNETWILHTHIAAVERLPLSTTGCPLQIRCKTFQSVIFLIRKENDSHDVYNTLLQLAQPVSIDDLYCFQYSINKNDMHKSEGWNYFNLEDEFKRMNVPNDEWIYTDLNENYELCDTYPNCLYVPANSTINMLQGSAKFRSKGRLPVLTYLHKNKASICRCSQPLSGFSARCPEDEQLLNCILETNPSSTYMYVVDTRPRINAMANRAAGKGYENEVFYENIKFKFFGIENIHTMRASLLKLMEMCEQKLPTMSSFLSGLESSGWLKHIKSILDTSRFIAQAVSSGQTVLVHCSDGWDRTAQVCSIASILLDPYYRTIKGYQTLIEKDWLAFGHKFTDRCGFLKGEPKEVAPVFTQLLDATWQLCNSAPHAFEFTERFLFILHDHVMSCQFGTFVGNCEKDRLNLKLSERTFSLWGYMQKHRNEYLNPLYKAENVIDLLDVDFIPQNIMFWSGMYNRFENGVHPREPLGDHLLSQTDHTASLKDHAAYLKKSISYFKTLLTTDLINRVGLNTKTEESKVENKSQYEAKSMSQLIDEESDTSHTNNSNETENSSQATSSQDDQLSTAIESVALDWKTLRNINQCICSTPFDHNSVKYHCYKCGDVFCTRCMALKSPLPGHDSNKPVSVCRSCYKELQRSTSIDTP